VSLSASGWRRFIVDWGWWDSIILTLIIAHWLLFCMEYRDMSKTYELTVHIVQTALLGVYILDVAMRIVVRGLRFEYNTLFFGVPISILEIVALISMVPILVLLC
jgi:hypothetical protein